MANIISSSDDRSCLQYSRRKEYIVKIDMPPMVDLGFLSICFFVVTTIMTKPVATDLFIPKDGPPTNIANSKSLTVLLDRDNKIFYYSGNWTHALANNEVKSIRYSYSTGIGHVIRERKKQLALLSSGNKREIAQH